jgi:hypothetical protein
MAGFKLKLEGNKALLKNLDKLNKGTKTIIGHEIEESINKIDADANSAIQAGIADKGGLKSNMHKETDKVKLRGQVEARAYYAPYIEFGTGGMVNVPQGLESYAMQFKGKGIKQVNLPPRPFLFPAFYAETPKLVERIKRAIKKWN